jgi:hypothetical protein
MTDSSSKISSQTQGGFHLSITFDAEHRVLSATVNDVPLPVDSLDRRTASSSIGADEGSCCNVEIPESRSLSQRILKTVLQQTLIAVFVVVLLQYLLYRYQFHDPDFVSRYGWWLFYLDASVIPIVTSIFYLRSFHYARMSHAMGMMIGMTIGMQIGAMVGAVIGATNGFFFGALTGMLLGVAVALYGAWCCGPMAVMHGLMSGVMGGTMGAMIIVMMIMDHVLIFMPVFTILNVGILAWFVYLYYKECCSTDHLQIRKLVNPYMLVGLDILIIGLLSALMIYGPRGPGSWSGERMDMNAANEKCADETADPFAAREGERSCKPRLPLQMVCGSEKMNKDEMGK